MIPRITFDKAADASDMIAALNIAASESYSKSSQYAQADDGQMARYHMERGDRYRALRDVAEEALQDARRAENELEILAQDVRNTLDMVRESGAHRCSNPQCLVNRSVEINASNVIELITEMQSADFQ